MNQEQKYLLTIFDDTIPSFIELKNELANIGNLVSISGMYTKGLRNNASHLIDLLIWLVGPIKESKFN